MKRLATTICIFLFATNHLLLAGEALSLAEGEVSPDGKNEAPELHVPRIAGHWLHIFNPNDKHKKPEGAWYTNDHSIVKTRDGRWHAYGIIGHRPANPWKGEDKLFHASADKLTDLNWKEHDYALVANKTYERVLWAPYVFKEKGVLHMFYNVGNMQENAPTYASWGKLCMATSAEDDGFTWKRHELNPLFSDPGHARDSFVMEEGGKYYFYYTKTVDEVDLRSAVAVRTGPDLEHWSGSRNVHIQPLECDWGGDCESPTVIKHEGVFYLFITLAMTGYDKTHVYWSEDPLDFPRENFVAELKTHAPEIVRDGDKWYITNTGWGRNGLYLAPLEWKELQK